MIKHHILWRLTDAGKKMGVEELVRQLNARFKALVGQIEGMQFIEIRACDAKGDPGYHDLMLYAEFSDKEALYRYMADAQHAKIREWDQEFVWDRAGFDYEA